MKPSRLARHELAAAASSSHTRCFPGICQRSHDIHASIRLARTVQHRVSRGPPAHYAVRPRSHQRATCPGFESHAAAAGGTVRRLAGPSLTALQQPTDTPVGALRAPPDPPLLIPACRPRQGAQPPSAPHAAAAAAAHPPSCVRRRRRLQFGGPAFASGLNGEQPSRCGGCSWAGEVLPGHTTSCMWCIACRGGAVAAAACSAAAPGSSACRRRQRQCASRDGPQTTVEPAPATPAGAAPPSRRQQRSRRRRRRPAASRRRGATSAGTALRRWSSCASCTATCCAPRR